MTQASIPRILSIAGSDSGGGAGIQADLKTITALGGFGMTAITAITAQNTHGVQGVWPLPIDAVLAQMESVVQDLGVDAIKTGMIPSAGHVEAIAEKCANHKGALILIDPVIVASSGASLAAGKTIDAFLSDFFPIANLVTPNSMEAEQLTGISVETVAGQHRAAERLMKRGTQAVLVKGGHLDSDEIIDVLHTQTGERELRTPRIQSANTHGTGCTLASAIATRWVATGDLQTAVQDAQAYVAKAITAAPCLGSGPHGPMNHGVNYTSAREDDR